MIIQSFILTSNYIDRNDGLDIILDVITPYGSTSLIFNNERSVFFIESAVDHSSLDFVEVKTLPLKTINEQSVKAIYFKNFQQSQFAKDKLEALGHRTYEADIRPHERFLMERFIFGSLEFEADSAQIKSKYTNPSVRKGKWFPDNYKVLSFDLETGVDGSIYSVGMHAYQMNKREEFKKVIMRSDVDQVRDEILDYVSSEQKLCLRFLEEFNKIDPDFIIGWNVIGFDLKFFERKFNQYQIPLSLGRDNRSIAIDDGQGMGNFARIPGRVVVDGPSTMKTNFFQFENFKLETVASEILGTGKDIASDGGKVEEIERRFREDKPALAKYNLLDCTLVSDIYKKTGLLELLINRSIISGMQIDRVGISTAAFDHLYLPLFHRSGYVAPNSRDLNRENAAGGGHVVKPRAGLFKHIIVLDFKSLYPSIIRTFNIDPLSLITAPQNPLSNPTEVKFSRDSHLLPQKIAELLELRAHAKRENNPYLSQAIKILMNSFYGVMGSARCRFYNAQLPNAITSIGQWIIKTTITFFENRDYKVIYGDTDSVFVQLKESEFTKFSDVGEQLAGEVTEYLKTLIKTDYGAISKLEMEYEKHFQQFFIPKARVGGDGAKKRYVGFNRDKDGDHLTFVGMEFVRSDWTKLAKNFQYELMKKIFIHEDYINWIKQYCDDIESGKYDDQLVYKKRITKKLEEYVKNIPPHIKAAKMIDHKGPYRLREVEYVMTKNGPYPIQMEPTDIDYQHYIEKQIAPLADSIIGTFGENFDSLREGSQLDLFDI